MRRGIIEVGLALESGFFVEVLTPVTVQFVSDSGPNMVFGGIIDQFVQTSSRIIGIKGTEDFVAGYDVDSSNVFDVCIKFHGLAFR